MKDIHVSHHASDRFYQRIFGKPDGDKPNTKERKHIEVLLLESLLEEHPESVELENGTYTLKAYGITITLRNKNITTVIETRLIHQDRSFKGGVMKCGRKIKKKTKLNAFLEREESNDKHKKHIPRKKSKTQEYRE